MSIRVLANSRKRFNAPSVTALTLPLICTVEFLRPNRLTIWLFCPSSMISPFSFSWYSYTFHALSVGPYDRVKPCDVPASTYFPQGQTSLASYHSTTQASKVLWVSSLLLRQHISTENRETGRRECPYRERREQGLRCSLANLGSCGSSRSCRPCEGLS